MENDRRRAATLGQRWARELREAAQWLKNLVQWVRTADEIAALGQEQVVEALKDRRRS